MSGVTSDTLESVACRDGPLEASPMEHIDAPLHVKVVMNEGHNNTNFQTDDPYDNLEEDISNTNEYLIAEENGNQDTPGITNDHYDSKRNKSSKKEQRRKKKNKNNKTPELTMSDRERKKREEMDHSSDQLIFTLNTEESNQEHLNLMRYLREMQKQEIVIEL